MREAIATYVIVPILHDTDATADDLFKSPAFKEILTTLRALAANDDRIIEYFRAISQGRQPNFSGGSVAFDLDERLAKRIDLTQFVREIELKCWDRLAKLSWRPFEDAREFARGLGLKNQPEWREFCKGNLSNKVSLPSDIPAKPDRTYADSGWAGIGDWLGTGNVADQLRIYRPFENARAFAHSLNLKSRAEWDTFCKGGLIQLGRLPEDIPSKPNATYADKGWAGMGDWIGTGNVANFLRQFRGFQDARDFARSLELKSGAEWTEFCKGNLPEKGTLPPDIPAAPQGTYAEKGWSNMGDWLGTGNVAPGLRRYRSFMKARAFARSLALRNTTEWREFCRGKLPEKGTRPVDIPVNPDQAYADKGWTGYGDWLGTGVIAPRLRTYRSFADARLFARKLNLKSGDEWSTFCKGLMPRIGRLPEDIPATPSQTYAKQGWAGMGDWLGTGTIANFRRKYRSFQMARAFARGLGLRSRDEWNEFCQGDMPEKGTLPPDIPMAPHSGYADQGWSGMGDWLGTGIVSTNLRDFRSFKSARDFARRLGLKNRTEWKEFCKGNLPDKGALPADIPSNPYRTYADQGWTGMGDWLGTGNIAKCRRQYLQFQDARAFARGLGLANVAAWRAFCRGYMPGKCRRPQDIPVNPDQTYADKGWAGYGDWLGTGRAAKQLHH